MLLPHLQQAEVTGVRHAWFMSCWGMVTYLTHAMQALDWVMASARALVLYASVASTFFTTAL